MDDKYVKIAYQSEPIGKEEIILYLTTLDLEAFEKDKKLEKIPTTTIAKAFEMPGKLEENSAVNVSINSCNQHLLEAMLKNFIVETYVQQINKMKSYIEYLRKGNINLYEVENYIKKDLQNAKNISNVDDVRCNIVYGNASNCDNVYCNEIQGNVTNCDKIVYK